MKETTTEETITEAPTTINIDDKIEIIDNLILNNKVQMIDLSVKKVYTTGELVLTQPWNIFY